MIDFKQALEKKVLVIDGAMGTQLMERGIRPEACFDAQNIQQPAVVLSVHQAYAQAGADIIETNTFGANSLKLADYGLQSKVNEINRAAAQLARQALGDKGFVCGSMGPLGKMLDPLGEVTFDQAVEIFAEQSAALAAGGADVLCIETISDLQEMRAAVIAARGATKLPIIASLTYDEGEKTIYGTPPEAAVVVLEALGIDVIAANCSTGPEGLLKICRKLSLASSKPIMVMPNAGMPELVGNKAIYKMTPAKFAAFVPKFMALGVKIIGGCCGTTPEHIRAVVKAVQSSKFKVGKRTSNLEPRTSFASRTKVVAVLPGKLVTVGERINPTGRPVFQAEIKAGKTQILRQESQEQSLAGAALLDVNVSVPDIVESVAMHNAVKLVASVSEQPLSIDSPNYAALEAGLKAFCGKALLNSVNGKKESIEKVIPLAKKYGAAIIALALDETGLPKTADDRLRIAERIVQSAAQAGIAKADIYVDNLVLTAGVGLQGCLETLKAIPLIKERLGVKTILGISNVSHGLPERAKLNALYLRLALNYGLDAAIVDCADQEIKQVLNEKKRPTNEVLLAQFKQQLDKARRSGQPGEKKRETKVKELKFTTLKIIKAAVIDGDLQSVEELVKQALAVKVNPQKIIDEALVPGMEVVGKRFSQKIYYLPQVIEAAEAMSRGFELCKARIPKGKIKNLGKVLLATVKGDIHDIGKNIVRMMLENHGFSIVDLGKDVPPETIIAAAKKEKPNVIALSALLTTTMVEMGIVQEQLKQAGLKIPLLVGGAVVTKGYADRIGANYSYDAVGAVQLAKRIIQTAKNRL